MATIADVDSCAWLYLMDLTEPRDNRLRLVVQEAGSRRDDPVAPTSLDAEFVLRDPILPNGRKFAITWNYYLGYAVRNEMHVGLDPYEQFSGRLFRTYSKSRFLDFLAVSTHTPELVGEALHHWGLCCHNHVIDIVGPDEPTIELME